VKINEYTFRADDQNEEPMNEFKLDVKSRGRLALFFDAWLTHHNEQKARWRKLIKAKCLLQRLRLNRVIGAWKKYTR